MAQIVNSWCVLAVRDLAVSTRYYMDILGFQKEPIQAEGWSFLTRDRFRVMLGECVDERPAGELGNHSYFAYWNVEGVDELYREFVAKGALVSSNPTNKTLGSERVRPEYTRRTQNRVLSLCKTYGVDLCTLFGTADPLGTGPRQ